MATKNIPLTINVPGKMGIGPEIEFLTLNEDDGRIPYRYPFADISNYSALKTDGFFRHETTDVSTDLGGSKLTNTEGKLGFQLPKTEKLILLVKKGATTDEKFTIKGNARYAIPDVEIATGTATAVGGIFEVDLFNYGLLITDQVSGELGIVVEVNSTSGKTLSFALIARMG